MASTPDGLDHVTTVDFQAADKNLLETGTYSE
jgi:hypothetical protein